MTPETLLAFLIQTREQLPDALDTPLLLRRSNRIPQVLAHPLIGDGGFSVDPHTKTALDELIRWGYLVPAAQDHGTGYLLTSGGLRYGALENEPPWDGSDGAERAGLPGA